jgi:hypothetical protein
MGISDADFAQSLRVPVGYVEALRAAGGRFRLVAVIGDLKGKAVAYYNALLACGNCPPGMDEFDARRASAHEADPEALRAVEGQLGALAINLYMEAEHANLALPAITGPAGADLVVAAYIRGRMRMTNLDRAKEVCLAVIQEQLPGPGAGDPSAALAGASEGAWGPGSIRRVLFLDGPLTALPVLFRSAFEYACNADPGNGAVSVRTRTRVGHWEVALADLPQLFRQLGFSGGQAEALSEIRARFVVETDDLLKESHAAEAAGDVAKVKDVDEMIRAAHAESMAEVEKVLSSTGRPA